MAQTEFSSLQFFVPALSIHGVLALVYAYGFDGKECDRLIARSNARKASSADDLAFALVHHHDFADDLPGLQGDPFVPAHEAQQEAADALREDLGPDASREEMAKEMGKRQQRSALFFRHPETSFVITALAAHMTISNFLTSWLLKKMADRTASPLQRQCGSIILDITWAPVSPIHLASQYLASCLMLPISCSPLSSCRRCGRLTLERIRQLHNLTMRFASGLLHRFTHTLNKHPFRSLQLSDGRRDDHSAIISELMALHECCPDVNFTLMFIELMKETCGQRDRMFIRSALAKTLFECTAFAIDGVCDDLEVRHKRNRGTSTESRVCMRTLASASTLCELKAVQNNYVDGHAKSPPAGDELVAALVDHAGGDCSNVDYSSSLDAVLHATGALAAKRQATTGSHKATCSNKVTGIHLYHSHRAKMQGQRLCCEQSWACTHYEWARLYIEEQQHWNRTGGFGKRRSPNWFGSPCRRQRCSRSRCSRGRWSSGAK